MAGVRCLTPARTANSAPPAVFPACHRSRPHESLRLPWLRSTTDALAFSSLWLAGAAASLVAATSRALGGEVDPALLGLAFSGTLVIYNVDRLRDLDSDRETAPARSSFVERHWKPLIVTTVLAGLVATVLTLLAGPPVMLLLIPALLLGLAHRRLKGFGFAKPLYIVGAWLLVVVGLPWAVQDTASGAPWCAAILGPAILANAITSNLRDPEAGAAALGPAPRLWIARAVALLGVVVAGFSPDAGRILLTVPAATGLSLIRFRASERYGLVVVDGALLFGGLAALLWSLSG